LLCRSLTEFQALQCEETASTDEVHSLLLDQEEVTVEKLDSGAITANQTLESAPQPSIRNGGFESTLLSQLDCIVHSPHLCREKDPSADAFGLRDMHHVAPEFSGYKTDTNLVSVQPSTGLPLFPPGGVQNIAQRYSKPFQQDMSLPLHKTTATSSDTIPNTYQNQNILLPLPFVEQNSDQPVVSLPSTDPPLTQHKLQPVQAVQVGNAVPYEQSASQQIFDTKNSPPFSPSHTTDGSNDNNTDLFRSHRQPFPSDVSPPFASVFDKHIPDAGSASHTSVGIIGDTKPVGFVPAVKGTTFKNETATESENVVDQGQDVAAAARLTTTARVPPSSTVKPQQQVDTSNNSAETDSSSVHQSETANECNATKDSTRPPFMPGFPAPWPMPPYPGGPVPYPFYPPWPYGPPMPVMPMMPHPMMQSMMQMVPVPCWMPPMHPAMRVRPPSMVPSVADANDKPEVGSETKP